MCLINIKRGIHMRKASILIFVLALFIGKANAQADKYKALFIYNFTKHIEWPANTKSGDFVIAVIGQKTLYDKLIEVTNAKKVGSQNIVVNMYKNIDEVGNCNIAVLSPGNSTPKKLEIVVGKVGASTLIVSNGNNSAIRGATINFVIQEGKLKFELNNSEAAKRQLKISSYLHNLAIIVG